MKKRVCAVLLILSMVFALAACGGAENQPETENNKTGVTENQPSAEDKNDPAGTENPPAEEDKNQTGTLDMQSALDAYNSVADVFNRAVMKITENMSDYPLTVIQAMGQKANDLTIYSELLTTGEALTEDQIREMVKQLAAIETWAANVEAGNLDDANSRDLSTAIAYCNALSTDFNGIAMYVNEVSELFSQDFINSMNETGSMLTKYQELLNSSHEFTDEEYDQMMNDFATIAQWLSDAEETVFG